MPALQRSMCLYCKFPAMLVYCVFVTHYVTHMHVRHHCLTPDDIVIIK